MKLMEYQAQTLFRRFGLPVQPGCVVDKAEDVAPALAREGLTGPLVVKAQVQIGGRGKAGGIRFAEDASRRIRAVSARKHGKEL